jgi:hypothetical protein
MRKISSPAHQAEILDDAIRKASKTLLSAQDRQTVWTGLGLFTLANFDRLLPLMDAQIAYCADEGLHPHEYWTRKTLTQKIRRTR